MTLVRWPLIQASLNAFHDSEGDGRHFRRSGSDYSDVSARSGAQNAYAECILVHCSNRCDLDAATLH